jgi:F0F1-type ATP synthase epsilon subunit
MEGTQFFEVSIVDQVRGQCFSDTVTQCTLPAVNGSISVYPNHADLTTLLREGPISITLSNSELRSFVLNGSGIAGISKGKLKILTNSVVDDNS